MIAVLNKSSSFVWSNGVDIFFGYAKVEQFYIQPFKAKSNDKFRGGRSKSFVKCRWFVNREAKLRAPARPVDQVICRLKVT